MFTGELLDARTLKRLEGYRLSREQPVSGRYEGAARSRQKGGAVEFADYREYVFGDEPRRVDWKAYARLGRLFVKEFVDEKQKTLLFIIDTSASMDWGGDAHKGRYALRLAAALGMCALAGSDRLAVVFSPGFSGGHGAKNKETAGKSSFVWKGRGALFPLWRFLTTAVFSGAADLSASFSQAVNNLQEVKSLYVISDFYDLAGLAQMLGLAAARDLEVTLLQVFSPQERLPVGEGEYLLQDAENANQLEITFSPAAYLAYSRRLAEFYRELDDICRRWGAKRVFLDSGENIADTLFKTLPKTKILVYVPGT